MIQALNTKNMQPISNKPPAIQGWWKFDEGAGNTIADSSGNGYTLIATGNPKWIREPGLSGAVALDGTTQWLSTKKPVLRTDESFSVAAWVRLDSNTMNGKLVLKPGEHALTAVSQDSPTHSAFYLGVRLIEKAQPDGTTTVTLNWSFTVSPIDGTETGTFDWQRAHSTSLLDDSALDKWVMLVGVCDVANRTAHIYVPSVNEVGTIYMPDEWGFWRAEGGLQIGRARWLERNVDQWPGHIGPVRAFSGVLKVEDAQRMYIEDSMKMSSSLIYQKKRGILLLGYYQFPAKRNKAVLFLG